MGREDGVGRCGRRMGKEDGEGGWGGVERDGEGWSRQMCGAAVRGGAAAAASVVVVTDGRARHHVADCGANADGGVGLPEAAE